MKNILIAVLLLVFFTIGLGTGYTVSHQEPQDSPGSINNLISSLRPGEEIELVIDNGEAGYRTKSEGKTTRISSKRSYWRVLSWFGLGATEAAAKDQGIQVPGTSIGQQKGYGFLEQLWERIKSLFWFGLFGMLILVVLAFVPATSTIARGILRAIASIFPFLGSLVERITAHFKWEKPLVQTVAGVQEVREAAKTNGGTVTIDQIDTSLSKSQDTDTKAVVTGIKTTL